MGAHLEALDEGVLMAPLDSRYSQVGFNIVFVQVCYLHHFEIHDDLFNQQVYSGGIAIFVAVVLFGEKAAWDHQSHDN